jgi:RNA polymerase sigma factor (TIGR02999 family)
MAGYGEAGTCDCCIGYGNYQLFIDIKCSHQQQRASALRGFTCHGYEMNIATENLDPSSHKTQTITLLLQEWQQGDAEALQQLMPLIYQELHQIAHRYMQQERPGHLWQTTALVHEAWLKLVESPQRTYQDRLHFLAVAARVMRHLLVDFARHQNVQKRGNGIILSDLTESTSATTTTSFLEVLALHEALERLAQFDPRKVQIVELRFFGGLSMLEIAHVLGIAEITVKREWLKTKAWLYRELNGDLLNQIPDDLETGQAC